MTSPTALPNSDPETRQIKVLAIAGSPRKRGNTDLLLDRFIDGARQAGGEVTKVYASRIKASPCIGCEKCFETGLCAIKDEYQDLFQYLLAADVIAITGPMYFWNVPAQAKIIIDRSECQWARKYILKTALAPTSYGHSRRRGVFISAGGQANIDFGGAVQVMQEFFSVWETDYWADLLCSAVDAKGAINSHPEKLSEAFQLGQRAVKEAW